MSVGLAKLVGGGAFGERPDVSLTPGGLVATDGPQPPMTSATTTPRMPRPSARRSPDATLRAKLQPGLGRMAWKWHHRGQGARRCVGPKRTRHHHQRFFRPLAEVERDAFGADASLG